MFIQASQLIGSVVFSLTDEVDVARIERLIIDPQTGVVVALGVKPHGWFTKEHLVAQSDILEVNPHGIAVRDQEQLVEPHELIRASAIIEQRIPVIGQKATTQSGSQLGTIDDLLLDLDTWMIAKYYVSHLMDERILLAAHVYSMTPAAIIFLDQLEDGDAAAAPEIAAA